MDHHHHPHPHLHFNARRASSSSSFLYRFRFLRRVLHLIPVIFLFRTFTFVDNNRFGDNEQLLEFKSNDYEKPCNCSKTSKSEERRNRLQTTANCTVVIANKHHSDSNQALKNILVKLRARQALELEFVGLSKLNDSTAEASSRSRILVRAFPRRQRGIPCLPPEVVAESSAGQKWSTIQRQPAHRGLFYVKTYKTGSTTVMGISIRIAMKSAERYNKLHNTTYTACKARFDHWPAYLLDYQNRDRQNSFLFAVLRDPTLRVISMFFHLQVSRQRVAPSDQNFRSYLTGTPRFEENYYPWGWSYDHYLHFLSTTGYNISSGLTDPEVLTSTVNQIIKDYDFIGVTERLDESLVAMQMILGLKTSDILYSSAKDIGSWDDLGVYVQPTFVSEGMKKFFAGDTWKALSKGDYTLYIAANASLDRTIDRLGRVEFDGKLALHRHAMKLVDTNCSKILPYWTAAGKAKETDCLVTDAGCGRSCFDQLERDFNI